MWGFFNEPNRYHIEARTNFPSDQLFGVEVVCPSMNQRYPVGTIVIALKRAALDGPIPDGASVVVEKRHGDDAGLFVRSFVSTADGRIWLLPASTLQDSPPLSFRPDSPDGIEIIGVVIGSYQPEPVAERISAHGVRGG